MSFTCYDVVVQTTGATQTPLNIFQSQPPIRDRVHLRADLWVGPISHDIDIILKACEPRGLNFDPIRQYGYHYCFVRESETETHPSIQWDEDQELQRLILLSRLIHPTTASNQYSARLIRKGGELIQIIPGPTQGFGAHVWVPREDWRDWLTLEDISDIRELLPRFSLVELPLRIRRALHHFHFSQLTSSLDQRVACVVTALESILKTNRNDATKQFKERVAQLSALLEMGINESIAKQFYDDRSGYLHGSSSGWIGREQEARSVYEKMEELLRKSLIKAVAEPAFAEFFISDANISAQFQLSKNSIKS
jgi:hypothetical protein